MLNEECRMQNVECRMKNEELGMWSFESLNLESLNF
jgi:hypothetical protein